MGCFDVVCALTNTPIKSGEECYLTILKKNAEKENWHSVTWLADSEGRWIVDGTFYGE
jgi:hypothetical protein